MKQLDCRRGWTKLSDAVEPLAVDRQRCNSAKSVYKTSVQTGITDGKTKGHKARGGAVQNDNYVGTGNLLSNFDPARNSHTR